jgi:hypothetical protein
MKALLQPGTAATDRGERPAPPGDQDRGNPLATKPAKPIRRAKDPIRVHAEALRTAAIYQAFISQPDVTLRIAVLDLADQIKYPIVETKPMKEAQALLALDAPDDRWQAVATLSAPKLRRLLEHLLAATIAPKLASLGRTPSLLAPAQQALSLGPAAAQQLDDALLQHYPKVQLIDLALACGAFPKERLPDLRKRTPRELRAAILESKTRNPDWLPQELRFDRSEDEVSLPAIEST